MERQRRKLENGMHCAENPSRGTLYKALSRVADSWARVILSNPATVVRAVHGEKGGAEIEASLPNPLRLLRPPPSRALPKISNPAISWGDRSICQAEDFIPY